PGRSNRAGLRLTSNTVDSNPPEVGPPSNNRSIRPSRLRSTCSALVGEMRLDRFALGAAMGTPAAVNNDRATTFAGTRNATVAPPAVTMSGTHDRFGTTNDNGPGQNRCANR